MRNLELEPAPTHAGGLVYRRHAGSIEYLMVRPKKSKDEWLLPKGHIESGEEPEQTAIREVQEETGVIAGVLASLDTIEFKLQRAIIRAMFFLMEFKSLGASDEVREIKWAKYQDSLTLLSHDQSRDLLRLAERTRRNLGSA